MNTIQIELTKNKIATISADDYDKVKDFKWLYNQTSANTGYAATFYTDEDGSKKILYMHKLLLVAEEGYIVDHKDGDTLNNTRDNLRQVTVQQNQFNRRKHSNNTSGFKGVCFHKRAGKWQATITKDGKKTFLGYYTTPEQASIAYQAAATALFGEYNRKNANEDI